jgi:translation factor GUF1, mitochondrial
MMEICSQHRGEEIDYHYINTDSDSSRIILTCKLPLAEVVTDFYGKIKSRSSGFASFE